MNIQSFTPKLSQSINQQPNNTADNSIVSRIKFKEFPADTVSFSGRRYIKTATNTISDCIKHSVENDKERMERVATTYLDALEAIASSLKNDGFSFDRAYCEQSPVKSAESYVSKISRSGSLHVPDTIRATLYCKNPYDLSLLTEKLLPEMKKRGYILSDMETPVKDLVKRCFIPKSEKQAASTVIVPDLDIRLEDVSDQIEKLPKELRYSISKPQKSGYEDIQMRFVRVNNDKAHPQIPHELIILFGPNYANAKHIESEKVYKFLRKFEELNINFDDKESDLKFQRAGRYADLIKQMFRGKISQQLFLNAKNKDFYDINEEIPIRFSDEEKVLFKNYFSELQNELYSYYSNKRKSLKNSNLALKALNTSYRSDKNTIREIQKGLSDTIDYFNYIDGVKAAKAPKHQ